MTSQNSSEKNGLVIDQLEILNTLLDDRKARKIAENFEINCIGTLGILSVARDKNLIPSLKPLFKILLANKRFYSIKLLNYLLVQHHEDIILD